MHEMSARVHALIRRSNLYQCAGENTRVNLPLRQDAKSETDEALLADKTRLHWISKRVR